MPLYYTLRQNNPTTTSIPLTFSKNLQYPFISDPSKYKVCLTFFELPNYNQPLFYFTPSSYYIELTYNSNITIPVEIPFIADSNEPYAVYEMQHWIVMLNNGIANAIIQYAVQFPSAPLPSTIAPYFVYNEITQLCSLMSPKNYYDQSLSLPISISVNEALLLMIHGFPVTTLSGHYFKINCIDLHNNVSTISGTDYITMTQQSPNLGIMTSFSSVLITSSLPVKSEYIDQTSAINIMASYSTSDISSLF
jgi:hypothetical protein